MDETIPADDAAEEWLWGGNPSGVEGWLRRTRRWSQTGEEILADARLTWASLETLILLGWRPHRSGELSAELQMTTGGLAKLLKRLEDQGYVVREADPGDQRVVMVSITDAGRTVACKAATDVLRMMQADFDEAALTKTERHALATAYRKFLVTEGVDD